MVSVTPDSGNANPNVFQVFTAVYSDPKGPSDLQVVYLNFGPAPSTAHSCFIAYVPANNGLYLFDDTNSSVFGPVPVGGNGSVSNSQCTMSATGHASTSGQSLTVPFDIAFSNAFVGGKSIFALAQSYSGAQSGWSLLGGWTVGGAPGAVSVSPNSGTGVGPQTFNAVYTDPAGASEVQVVYLDIGKSVFAANSCIAAYVPASNAVYLFNDSNSSVTGPVTAGGAGTLSNSQCTLSSGAPVTVGNNITVPFIVTFLTGFTGPINVYGYAQNYSGTNNGCTMLGTWTPSSALPLGPVSVTPMSGSGMGPQIFNGLFTDPKGYADLQVAYLDFGTSPGAPNSCIAGYVPSSHSLSSISPIPIPEQPGRFPRQKRGFVATINAPCGRAEEPLRP